MSQPLSLCLITLHKKDVPIETLLPNFAMRHSGLRDIGCRLAVVGTTRSNTDVTASFPTLDRCDYVSQLRGNVLESSKRQIYNVELPTILLLTEFNATVPLVVLIKYCSLMSSSTLSPASRVAESRTVDESRQLRR